MFMMRANKYYKIIICFLIFIIIFSCYWSNSLRRSDESIKRELLVHYKLGTNIEVVIGQLREREVWFEVSTISGVNKQKDGHSEVLGSKSIDAFLGDYHSSIYILTVVSAHFAFNDKNELIDIFVSKTLEGP